MKFILKPLALVALITIATQPNAQATTNQNDVNTTNSQALTSTIPTLTPEQIEQIKVIIEQLEAAKNDTWPKWLKNKGINLATFYAYYFAYFVIDEILESTTDISIYPNSVIRNIKTHYYDFVGR